MFVVFHTGRFADGVTAPPGNNDPAKSRRGIPTPGIGDDEVDRERFSLEVAHNVHAEGPRIPLSPKFRGNGVVSCSML